MKAFSKNITSNQIDIHPQLDSYISKFKNSSFHRPISEESKRVLKSIKEKYDKINAKGMILDSCCGVGLSTFILSVNNPDILVVGIDKSVSRVERQNTFKKKIPDNCLILKGNIIDLWYLLSKEKDLVIQKNYLLYPNPYPKLKHLTLRWYGHFIFPYLLNVSKNIEVRSNWDLYLLDFEWAAKQMGYESKLEKLEQIEKNGITLFEKKYYNSGHQLYRLLLNKKGI